MGYRNCLTIGVSPEGFYLAILFLFRIGHPPMFIPWKEIKIKRKKIIFGFKMLEFSFNHLPAVSLMIPAGLENLLTQAAGGRLPFVGEFNCR
ncbi:MAG: hypothetical protein PHC71_05905 [Candidatus Omnitrophica bacterium]|nr:hypothetical protein [Candidatus Omnitrophota bacterium]